MNNKFLSALALLLMLLLLVLTPQHGYSQSPTATAVPTIEVAATMDAVPTNCGQLSESVMLDPQSGRFIGVWPIYAGLPNWEGQTQGILVFPTTHYQTNDQLVGWWVTKMGWFVSESYTGEVKVRAFNLADHSPIYFERTDAPATVMTLDPAHPGGFVNGMVGWAFFPSLLWVSKAGCYQLEATWEGGLWQQVIAVGAVP